jgi:hypothetical protein
MRKTAAFVLLLLVLSAGASQADVQWGIGAKGGVNISELTGELPEGRTSEGRPGPLLGMIVHASFGSILSLQGEVNYSSEGSVWKFQEELEDSIWVQIGSVSELGTYNFEQTIKLTYLEIPLLAMLKLPLKGKWIPYAYAGPTLGFNITANSNIDAQPADGTTPLQPFFQGQVINAKSFDFQGSIGAGLGYKISDLFATIDIRYSKSFSGVFDDADPGSFTVVDDFFIPQVEYPIVDPGTGKAYDLKNEAWTITISAVGIL